MDFPTLQEIGNYVATGDPKITDRFEYAHKTQLFFLFQAGTLAQNMAAKLKTSHTQAQLDSYKKFLASIYKFYLNWLNTQKELENASNSIPKTNLTGGDIFTANGLIKIKKILNSWSNDKVGLGFIPIIVGAIAGLIALWGIFKISQRFTTTVQDKIDLLKQTEQTVKDMGLTTEQAAKLLVDTQEQASAGTGIGDLLKYGILAFAAIQLVPMFSHKKN